MEDNTNFAKRIILEFLDYIRYKVEHDKLTMKEADSIARTIEENLDLTGTVDELSEFYGQSKTNIKTVICRKMLSKPQRRVFYSFNAFRKVIPQRWRR